MSAQPSRPVAPDPRPRAGVAERDVAVSVGWRVEREVPALRAVPYLVRGRSGWLDAHVRYAVPLTPAWHKP